MNLPRLISPKRQVVFRDSDGDGIRDRAERGVAGVVIRCGMTTLVTDDEGRFGCPESQQMEVDIRTLPDGMLAPNESGKARARDIALRIVAPVRVQLMLTEVDSFRVTQADLEKAVVLARDSAGTLWSARSTGAGAFLFDALPIGKYTVLFEQGEVAEPLTAQGESPSVTVGDVRDGAPLTVVLQPRGVRVRRLGNTSPQPTSDSNHGQQDNRQRERLKQKLPLRDQH
jgi:hypothetical protein